MAIQLSGMSVFITFLMILVGPAASFGAQAAAPASSPVNTLCSDPQMMHAATVEDLLNGARACEQSRSYDLSNPKALKRYRNLLVEWKDRLAAKQKTLGSNPDPAVAGTIRRLEKRIYALAHQAACLTSGIKTLTDSELVTQAGQCRDNDHFNICDPVERKRYFSLLKEWVAELDNRKNKLEPINAIRDTLKGRIKMVQGIRPQDCSNLDCDDCDTVETCRERCDNNHDKMNTWRTRYQSELQGYQYLDCKTCLGRLQKHYEHQQKLYKAGRLNEENLGKTELLDDMWGILYCLSQARKKTDADSKQCMDTAIDLFPSVILPPSEMIKALKISVTTDGLTPEDINEFGDMFKAIGQLSEQEREIYLENPRFREAMAQFTVLALKKGDPETINNLGDILKSISQLSEEEREIYLENPKFREAMAQFTVLALKKGDPETINLLKELGFNHDDLIKIIKTYFTGDKYRTKEKFFEAMVSVFDRPGDITKIAQKVAIKMARIGEFGSEQFAEDENFGDNFKLFLKNYPPEQNGPIPPAELKYKYFKSFLMPGHVRTHYETDPPPPLWVDCWNYSNFVLLGLSLAAEMSYINSDYEDDSLYRTGVAGIYLFALNGIIGVIHAGQYEPASSLKKSRVGRVDDSGLGLSFSEAHMAMVYRIKF